MRISGWGLTLAVLPLALLSFGCEKEGCLGNEKGCRVESPCAKLTYACDATALSVKQLTQADDHYRGLHGLAGVGDFELSNGQVTAVIAGVGNGNHVDKNGGGLLDLF